MKRAILAGLVFLLLAGCSGTRAVEDCRSHADEFMRRLALRDFAGAHALCEPARVKQADLEAVAAMPWMQAALRDYQGLEHGTGGQYESSGGDATVRLPPATLKGHAGITIEFSFRQDGERWLLAGLDARNRP